MSAGIFTGGLGGNNYMVDGVDSSYGATTIHDTWNPIDTSVQEVSVQSTMYDAQYGWSTGGVGQHDHQGRHQPVAWRCLRLRYEYRAHGQ